MQNKRISLLFTTTLLLLLFVALSNILLSDHHSNLFPLVVMLPSMLLCLLIIFWDYRGRDSSIPADHKRDVRWALRAVKVYLGFGGFMVATLILGFGFAAPLFVLGYLLVIGKKGLVSSALYTVMISAMVYFILNRTLGMSWPPGLLIS